MGLFNWGKKQKDSVAPARTPQPPPAATDRARSISQLMEAAARGESGSMSPLWSETYRCDQWCFVSRAPIGATTFQPFCGVVDGHPTVFAFTDDNRACEFARKQQLMVEDMVPILAIARDTAIAQVLGLQSSGVERIQFNDAYFAPLSNLLPMYSHILNVPLAETARRFGQDPAALLHDRLSQTGHPLHLRELIEWALAQPEWWMFAAASAPSQPMCWTSAEGEQVTAVFTSLERCQRGAEMMKLAPPEAAPFLRLSVDEAMASIRSLVEMGKLQTVALNLRVPMAADRMVGLGKS